MLISDGSGGFTPNLNDIPYPPKGTLSNGSECVTGMGSISLGEEYFWMLLEPTALDTANYTNNMDAFPSGAADSATGAVEAWLGDWTFQCSPRHCSKNGARMGNTFWEAFLGWQLMTLPLGIQAKVARTISSPNHPSSSSLHLSLSLSLTVSGYISSTYGSYGLPTRANGERNTDVAVW